jgi:flagellar protein FlaJ
VTQRDPLQREEILHTIVNYFKNLPKASDSYWRDFQTHYMTSGITTYLDDYIIRVKQFIIISFAAFFLLGALVFGFILHMQMTNFILGSLATALIGAAITGAASIYYPYYRTHESKTRLEDGLIYFLSYMTVLSASGMPIEKILDRITEVEDNPPLVLISKKFLMDIRLFGMDVRTALKDMITMSPSKTLVKQIESIRTTIATSGDLKTLLQYEVDRQLQAKREKLKAKINTLVYIGELYVALMVVTPTIFIIIISILSIIGANAVGGSAVTQLNLIVFIGVPILAGVFILLLDQTMGREE